MKLNCNLQGHSTWSPNARCKPIQGGEYAAYNWDGRSEKLQNAGGTHRNADKIEELIRRENPNIQNKNTKILEEARKYLTMGAFGEEFSRIALPRNVVLRVLDSGGQHEPHLTQSVLRAIRPHSHLKKKDDKIIIHKNRETNK